MSWNWCGTPYELPAVPIPRGNVSLARMLTFVRSRLKVWVADITAQVTPSVTVQQTDHSSYAPAVGAPSIVGRSEKGPINKPRKVTMKQAMKLFGAPDELFKPCPFCGAQPKRGEFGVLHADSCFVHILASCGPNDKRLETAWQVRIAAPVLAQPRVPTGR